MNKFNKGKLIGVVAASLSAVSLMGVGFATWIIGTKTTTDNNDISIVADDVQYKSLKVSVRFVGNIKLAETEDVTPTDKGFAFEGEKGNLTVKACFKFTVGKDFTGPIDYNKVHFTINPIGSGNTDNKVAHDDIFTREKADNLTYFDEPSDLTVDFSSVTFKSDLNSDGMTKDSTAEVEKDITFKWGSLFDHKSPMKYYNDNIGDQGDTYMLNAYSELKAMNTKYASDTKGNKKISLKIELTKE